VIPEDIYRKYDMGKRKREKMVKKKEGSGRKWEKLSLWVNKFKQGQQLMQKVPGE
jgi:hypothetical protein